MDIALLIVGIIIIVLLIFLIVRTGASQKTDIKPEMDSIRSYLEMIQKENRDSQSSLRQEVSSSIKDNMTAFGSQLTAGQERSGNEQIKLAKAQREQLEIVGNSQLEQLSSMNTNISNQLKQLESRFATLENSTETKLQNIRDDNSKHLEQIRGTVDEKLQTNLESMNGSISANLKQLESRFATLENSTETKLQNIRDDNSKQLEQIRRTVDEKLQTNLESMNGSISGNLQQLESRFATLETTVQNQLKNIRDDNNKQLEQIRGTVDEKLQTTLENKMNESFKLVSERLEQVYKGLGEMQNVAQGVGDLKKVLSNVKTRGILGEIQLGAILKEILTPEQYDENVATVPKSKNRVEFAVKLPGLEEGKTVYLPIDSKFPGDRFAHLQDAYETGDKELISSAKKELVDVVKKCAKDISTKYIESPYTTQFAIMFLPFEGLYAEVVNTPGLVEELQRTYNINAAGPSTMAAMLNSLKMGFQTLAIQKRSGEVWEVLGAVKTEFAKFEGVLEKARKNLKDTEDSLELLVGVRTRQMNRKLNKIDKLDTTEAVKLLESE